MSCSDLDNATKMQLYYALKNILGCGDHLYMGEPSTTRFLESVEKRDPELVATTLARVRLGLPLTLNILT
jgi:hypothetical protein